MLPDQHRSDTVSRLFSEAPSRHPDHDEFKLHFPVPRDRTMRRIALIQLFVIMTALASCVGNAVLRNMSTIGEPGSKHAFVDYSDLYAKISLIFGTLAILSIIGIFVMIFVHSLVMTRRYGWRAMQDPIEARRVAVREGLADVLTAVNTRPPEDSQQIDHRPIRRLRRITTRSR